MTRLLCNLLARFATSRRLGTLKKQRPDRSASSTLRCAPPRVEALEERTLLSFTPIQIRHAYGFDRVGFEDAAHPLITGDGAGQTIGIVDAFDDPNIASNLATFDATYGLPDPPSFSKVNQTGGTTYPAPNAGWATEIALDVEYAHAMAPGANILLVEATNAVTNNLYAAVQYAASQGAAAVSMSFGSQELSTETLTDNTVFTHSGTTYMAASGDNGRPGFYPAYSPNVVAVGGTTLSLSGGNYGSESGWSGSGGGISLYESQPAYQNGVVDAWSTTRRTIPDVAFVANPATGVIIYDTFGGPGFYTVGGTSAASPIMAGLTAVIDQGRSFLFGRASYDSRDFLNALYHLPQSDLVDIVTGNNGFPAGPGYDLVTGRGSPIADRFVSGMIGAPVYNPLNGALLVIGGGRGGNDTITLSQSGGQLFVHVVTDTPPAGSGIPADQTFTFNSDQYTSVTVATSDGATNVNILGSTPTVPVRLVAADGTNTLTGPDTVNTWRITGLGAGTLNSTITFSGFQNLIGGSAADTFILSNGAGVTGTIDGGGGNNTLVGPNTATTWNITGTNAGTVSSGASTSFVNIQNLTGGSGADTFIVSDGAGVSGIIDGGGGSNTLDYSAYTTAVTVNLQTNVVNMQTLIGGSGANTLVGPNTDTIWNITSQNAGTLSGGISFTAFQNLIGGSGADTFIFSDGVGVDGTIDGGGGTNTLDYSAYTTSVIVDLQTGQATATGGEANIVNVHGANSAGSGLYNLLIGNGGNVLTGGSGRRNLLVAGGSASTLLGGNGEDLLIGGTTTYDTEAGLVSWQAIANYWAGADPYSTRVSNLESGSGVPLLDATIVTGNGGGNTMTGSGGLALIYTDGFDNITCFDPGSMLYPITP
jgi:hypothetical protein